MGLFDNIISRPTTGGSERPPRLRKAKSWMGRPRSHGTRQHHWTNSATGSTVDETTANVLTSEEASEHDGKIDSDYISHSGSKTVNDVTFESITPTDPDPKRPKRLVGIISHLRNHRFQRLSSPVREVRSHRRGVDESGDGGTAKLIANPTVSSTANPSVRLTPNPTAKPNPVISQTCSSEKPSEADEAREDRKVSDRTVFTEKSDTAATVCRHPSQRTLTPITIVDRDYNYDNPFEDVRDPAGYNPFTDQERVSSQPSVLDHDDRPPRVLRHSGMLIDRPKNLLSTSRGRFSSKNSSYMSSGEMERSSDSRWSSHFDHRRAAEAFNDLAGRLNLQPLKLCSFNKPASGEFTGSDMLPV